MTTFAGKMKHGLVLEGGGLRSLFSAGVMDVMMESGIEPDGIIGVSAGATFGCNYKSRQPGRALRYNMRFRNDWRYISLRSWITTGDLVGARFSYHVMPTELDVFDREAYRQNPASFYVVCTDVENGLPAYHRIDEMDHTGMEWLRASASMPVVSCPVELEGRKYLDGGISDSIPLQFFQREGYERCVVILTQPAGFRKKPTRLMPLLRVFEHNKAIVDAMARRHEMYNAQLDYVAEQQRLGRILLIQPQQPLGIGRTELKPEKMQRVYDLGRRTGEEWLARIREFMEG